MVRPFFGTFPGLVDGEWASHEIPAIERFNSTQCVLCCCHFDKRETTGVPGFPVAENFHRYDAPPVFREERMQLMFFGAERQVSNVKFFVRHFNHPVTV